MLGNVHVGSTNNVSLPRDSRNAKIWGLLRNAKPQMDIALALSRKRKKDPVEDSGGEEEEDG